MVSTLGWGELPKQNPRMEPRVFSLASFPFSCLASWIYPHRTTQGTQGTPAPLALIDVPLVALAGDLLMATRPNATLPGFPSSARTRAPTDYTLEPVAKTHDPPRESAQPASTDVPFWFVAPSRRTHDGRETNGMHCYLPRVQLASDNRRCCLPPLIPTVYSCISSSFCTSPLQCKRAHDHQSCPILASPNHKSRA
jgi:hypothetical protein